MNLNTSLSGVNIQPEGDSPQGDSPLTNIIPRLMKSLQIVNLLKERVDSIADVIVGSDGQKEGATVTSIFPAGVLDCINRLDSRLEETIKSLNRFS